MGRVLVQQPGTNTTKALSETLPKNVIIVDEDLKELRLHDGVTPGGKIIGQSAGSGVPIGTIIPFAGNSVPQGYLLCDGSAISRTDYASLFAVIGTIYGAGDGNSTFNLPSTTSGLAIIGTAANYLGTTSNGYVPNIKGSAGVYSLQRNASSTQSGALYNTGATYYGYGSSTNNTGLTVNIDASRSSSLYVDGATHIRAASIAMLFCIKYI